MIIRFKDHLKLQLSEAVKSADTLKVANLIRSYLSKKISGGMALYPAVEQFKTPEGLITTLTYINAKGIVLRFNWLANKIDQNELHSVNWWDATGTKYKIKFDKNISLVQSLPHVVDIVNHKKTGDQDFYLDESFIFEHDVGELTEAKTDNPLQFVKDWIAKLDNGDKVSTTGCAVAGGSMAYKLIRQVVADNPKAFEGGKLVNKAAIKWQSVENTFLDSKVSTKVLKDTSKEQWVQPPQLKGMEEEVEEQISYMEKIADLHNMLKFMVKGATNAIFVAGRGGCLQGNTEINIQM